jgi:hypothetical protein
VLLPVLQVLTSGLRLRWCIDCNKDKARRRSLQLVDVEAQCLQRRELSEALRQAAQLVAAGAQCLQRRELSEALRQAAQLKVAEVQYPEGRELSELSGRRSAGCCGGTKPCDRQAPRHKPLGTHATRQPQRLAQLLGPNSVQKWSTPLGPGRDPVSTRSHRHGRGRRWPQISTSIAMVESETSDLHQKA